MQNERRTWYHLRYQCDTRPMPGRQLDPGVQPFLPESERLAGCPIDCSRRRFRPRLPLRSRALPVEELALHPRNPLATRWPSGDAQPHAMRPGECNEIGDGHFGTNKERGRCMTTSGRG